jgi:peptide/nickel transport system ATP-binding protein
VLEVEDLKMYYETLRGYVKAVDEVSFKLEKGHALGLAGESGCGKTSVALTILKLLPSNAKVIDGNIILDGENLLKMSNERFRKEIRWKRLSVIFQGAMNALNPVRKVGDLISEAILTHEDISKNEASERAGKLLDLVGIGAERIERYPHELSGGMKQRTMIAMALACNPSLVIADEPTTALDVIIQAQVLRVMKELRQKLDLSMILISHDLSIIAETCNKCAIMYAGKIMEYGDTLSMFREPLHPYTKKLISAFPSIVGEKRKLSFIKGFPPNLLNPPSGCRFHPRCPYVTEICRSNEPKILQVEKEHYVACHMTN